jgi:hypothetical protein
LSRVAAIAVLVTVAALAACAPVLAATPRVPASFVGVVADGPLFEPEVNLDGELSEMVGSGVQSLRVTVDWREAQPYASWSEVPPDRAARFRDENGVPTDYSLVDAMVEGAVRRRLTVLPVVMLAPRWAARHPDEFSSPPKGVGPYSRFAGALARRYGPGGSFWAENPGLPEMPVRYWQFWNEPSLEFFWSDQPWQRDYVALLRAARKEVRRVDSGARIVLAGLPNRSWPELESLYKLKARGLFEVAAVHPFTGQVSNTLKILRLNREVMDRYGDRRKPLMVTELSWTSAKGKAAWTYGNETTEEGQAKKLSAAFELLARHRRELRLARAYWYTWLTRDAHPNYPFDYAGLSRLGGDGRVVRKPAFKALRRTALALEGCASKSGTARSCERRR